MWKHCVKVTRFFMKPKENHDVAISIQPIAVPDPRFLAFSDASFASKANPDSHTGSIILATHRAIEDNISCPVSPLSWGCKKIQKVVTSTLAAETMSLASNVGPIVLDSFVLGMDP